MKKSIKRKIQYFNHDLTCFTPKQYLEKFFFSTPFLLTQKPLKKKYTYFSTLKWRLASLTKYYVPTEVPIDPRGPTGFYNLEDIEMEPIDENGNSVYIDPYVVRQHGFDNYLNTEDPASLSFDISPENFLTNNNKLPNVNTFENGNLFEVLWPLKPIKSPLNLQLHRESKWEKRANTDNNGQLSFRTLLRLMYRGRRYVLNMFESRKRGRPFAKAVRFAWRRKSARIKHAKRRNTFRKLTGQFYNMKYLNWLCHDAFVVRFPVNHKRRAERNFEKSLRDKTFLKRFNFWTEEVQEEVRPWFYPRTYSKPTGGWFNPVLPNPSDRLHFIKDPILFLGMDLYYRLQIGFSSHLTKRTYFFNKFWFTWRAWKWGNLWRNYVAVRQFNLGNFTGVRNYLIRAYMPRDRRYFARRNFFFHYWRYLWKIRRHYKFKNTIRRSVAKFYDFKFQRFANVYLLSLEAILVRILNIKNILYARALIRSGHVLVNGAATFNGRKLLGRFDIIHFSNRAKRWLGQINRRKRRRLVKGSVLRRRRDPKAFFYGRRGTFAIVINPRRLQSRTYFKGQFSGGVSKRSLRYLYNMVRR